MATAHSALTGSELHEPKGASGASSNQTYVSDGAGSGSWDEPEPKDVIGETAGKVYVSDGANSGAWTPRFYTLTGVIADISTAETVYVPVPYSGNVVSVVGVLEGAITGSDATITVDDNAGNAMAAITVSQSGSAAGDVDSATPATNEDVTDNDFITVETDGASTGNFRWWFTVVIERDD